MDRVILSMDTDLVKLINYMINNRVWSEFQLVQISAVNKISQERTHT
jgi:hypothetical protein